MPRRKQLEVFARTAQKTTEIIAAIGERLGWKDRERSYSALRAVIHVLRDRLPADTAVMFAAQMPMLMRGFYYEGWKPARTPVKMVREEFVGEIERLVSPPFEENIEDIIAAVMDVLGNKLGRDEVEKIRAALPQDIREIL